MPGPPLPQCKLGTVSLASRSIFIGLSRTGTHCDYVLVPERQEHMLPLRLVDRHEPYKNVSFLTSHHVLELDKFRGS